MVGIHHDENRHGCQAFVDAQLAGICQCEADGGHMRFTCTRCGSGLDGDGVGSALVRSAPENSRAKGKQLTPAWAFIRDDIGRHAGLADLLAR